MPQKCCYATPPSTGQLREVPRMPHQSSQAHCVSHHVRLGAYHEPFPRGCDRRTRSTFGRPRAIAISKGSSLTRFLAKTRSGWVKRPSAALVDMNLSRQWVLVFILRDSGCAGRLEHGRIERHPIAGLNVYDAKDALNEYISGARMRSWCVFGPDGTPATGWCHIHPDDAMRLNKTPTSS